MSDEQIKIAKQSFKLYLNDGLIKNKLGYKVVHKIAHKVISDTLFALVKDKVSQNLLDNYEEEKSKV